MGCKVSREKDIKLQTVPVPWDTLETVNSNFDSDFDPMEYVSKILKKERALRETNSSVNAPKYGMYKMRRKHRTKRPPSDCRSNASHSRTTCTLLEDFLEDDDWMDIRPPAFIYRGRGNGHSRKTGYIRL